MGVGFGSERFSRYSHRPARSHGEGPLSQGDGVGGYYDLATPYYAANYVIDHLGLPANFRQNISVETYDSGHMAYVNEQSLAKMKQDVTRFMDMAIPAGR